MKFWKSLSNLIEETLPDWRDKFLSYKDLKKQLKLIYPKDAGDNKPPPPKKTKLSDTGNGVGGGGDSVEAEINEEGGEVTKEVSDFVRLLEEEIEKFNGFFVDQEEEYVIKWKELQDRVAKAKVLNEDLTDVGREIVDFHGEMVLLVNYSTLNYTGLVKIMKKYDKRTGALMRMPFIQRVLQQPFFSTDLLNKLVKECEMMHDHLFPKNDTPNSPKATTVGEGCDSTVTNDNGERPLKVPKELAEIENMESTYVKLTLSALRVLKEIRSGSSTVNEFSLPPLQGNAADDLKNIPVIEQTAK
ncbi:hypothetical protein FEM48_Zijuj06G0143100 [Ziziphus jujuba var. spinosa]|uniref:SPX domain-containing protein n=1 Tax=Ziziphus jujuba var. spinosa TaxID=714518 RepID=A0A978V9S5_ZIZJJ|nr:hypothetical protein FEM48_Zijuj06G0143100 [Ziziphus jujuba var. spinosa]